MNTVLSLGDITNSRKQFRKARGCNRWGTHQAQSEPMHQDQRNSYESLPSAIPPAAAEWLGMQMRCGCLQERYMCLPLHWWPVRLAKKMVSRPDVDPCEVKSGRGVLQVTEHVICAFSLPNFLHCRVPCHAGDPAFVGNRTANPCTRLVTHTNCIRRHHAPGA